MRFVLFLVLMFTSCVDYENIDEFKKLDGRKNFEISDDEKEELILSLQTKIVEGRFSAEQIDDMMILLGADRVIMHSIVADFNLEEYAHWTFNFVK